MVKDRILCLIGASGAGKTTAAKSLMELGVNVILSYTSRRIRAHEDWGHIFINDWDVKEVEGKLTFYIT